jgi:2-C-methyl-D-erythritol 4-phosphate cytidylyltransferase
MKHALIFAGGTGVRMNARAKPKQFLELHGKPVIIYTIEHFEAHPQIDDVIVVCISSWIDELKYLLNRFDIKKVKLIVAGSDAGGDKSILNGLNAAAEICEDDDIILIHDGVRPIITADLISENITKAMECGNAITVEHVSESAVRLDAENIIIDVPERDKMYTAKAPQTFKFREIRELYNRADKDGVRAVDSAALFFAYGVKMFTVPSSPNNVKITTPSDYYIFRALFEAMENEQILGIT